MNDYSDSSALSARCATTPRYVRADDLKLGDRVLMAAWNGGQDLETVTCLELVGDDVIVNNHYTTSRGNTFQRIP